MAKKKKDKEIQSMDFSLVDMPKNKVQPVTIENKFVSIACYHYAEVDRWVPGKGKDAALKKVQQIERIPLMVIWDGKKFSSFMAEAGKEIEVLKRRYVIDRDIDETPLLPSESFITQLCGNIGMNMMKEFDIKKYFDEVYKYFEYYFYMPSEMLYNIVTLFAINQLVFDCHDASPYMYIRSPMRGCGKSHLGQSIAFMTNGIISTNIKAHHAFRMTSSTKTTIVFEEVKGMTGRNKDNKEIQDLLSLINAGFQKDGSKVPRLEETNKKGKMKFVLYDTYAPKVIITTHLGIPEDTMSRCIEIMMQKAPPDRPDYGSRWNQRARKQNLRKLREMGVIFRMKYGMEIKAISENENWRDELDAEGVFKKVRNRELEVFRPLLILCMKYMPKWIDEVKKFVRKNIEMRENLRDTFVNAILYALRAIYHDAKGFHGGYDISDEKLVVDLEEDKIEGEIMYIPIKIIKHMISQHSDIHDMSTKGASIRVGQKLTDLGFTGVSKRTSAGITRVVPVRDLAELCKTYLGMPLGESDEGDYDLSQQEKMDLVKDLILENNGKLELNELIEMVDRRIPEEDLRAVLKHMRERGHIDTISEEGEAVINWLLW